MEKSRSFVILSLFVFLAAFSFIPKSVFADGMIMKPDPYSDRWDYSGESNQQAFINYDNGLQKMIISVGLEEKENNGAVWLFPIPANPNKVAIDVVKSLPRLNGEEISKKAKSNLDDAAKFLQMTQIYTIPFMSYGTLMTNDKSWDNSLDAPKGIGRSIEQDVVVYEHLEKEGVTSEIITAKTASGLYDYLQSKGLKIESGSIPVLDNYIGKDYSFVASWISSPISVISEAEFKNYLQSYIYSPDRNPKLTEAMDSLRKKYPDLGYYDHSGIKVYQLYTYFTESPEGRPAYQDLLNTVENDSSILEADNYYVKPEFLRERQKGVFVTFPTKDIYFPLLPTSVYGSKTVPATIRIIGHVSPKIFQDIKSYAKTEYYVDNYTSFADDLKSFYSGKNQNIKYTKIEINAPSKFLTDDLWINNQAPVKTYYSTFIAKHPIASTIILLMLSSIIAGILAGLIIFRDLRKNPVKLGLIGLSNCLTLLGLLITTALVGTKNKNETVEPLLAEVKQKGYFWERRVAIILFFAAAPFLLFGLLALPSFIRDIFRGIYSYPNAQYLREYSISDFAIPFLIIYVLPISVFIAGFVIKKIKSEDRNLFERLKSAGYSSWSFQPKDKTKIAFIPVFSVSFLIISWLLVKLVGFTV